MQSRAAKEMAFPGVTEADISDSYLVPHDLGPILAPGYGCHIRVRLAASGGFCCPDWERFLNYSV